MLFDYKDLDDIIRCGNGMNQLICLSGNKFVNEQGDKSTTEQIEKQININKNLQESFKMFDLRNYNFTQEEKVLLSKKLQYMNLVLCLNYRLCILKSPILIIFLKL